MAPRGDSMLRRLVLVVPVSFGWACALVGCSLAMDPSSLSAGLDAVSESRPHPEDASDSHATPDADASDARGHDGSSLACPQGPGPSMVRIDDQCVDSTEVTREDYDAFLASVGPDAGGPAEPQCARNTTLVPSAPLGFPPPPPPSPRSPIQGIDWCDAKAYCAWAGKKLCGALRGGPVELAAAADPSVSLWAKACSRDGTRQFGYGDKYVRLACNVEPPGARPANGTCEGGYPGLFDMVGNAAEWIDACDSRDPQATCAAVGGFASPRSEGVSCTTVETPQGGVPWPSIGVRCCAPAR